MTVDPGKIYTSNFAYAGRHADPSTLVAICRGVPPWFHGETYPALAPNASLLSLYKTGRITEAEFSERYRRETLSKLDPAEVFTALRGKVLVCWCARNAFCHRRLVLKWLADGLGEDRIGGEL